MANLPTTESDLEIIGTARKPTLSDLRERGLIGLPDLDPEILFRRAEFELEQAELKARVRIHEGEVAMSFLRTKLFDAQESEGGVGSGSGSEGCESARSEEVNVEYSRVEERVPTTIVHVGMPNLPDLPVAIEACGAEKVVRALRDRNPIQLRPYAVEREIYRQMIAVGTVKA